MTAKQKNLKSFLQDIVIFGAMWLVLTWTGLHFDWYHWLVITVGFLVFGIKCSKRWLEWGIDATICQISHMPAAEREELFEEHIKENGALKE